ncbi:MAG: DUF262 domain-containing protein [Lachnospiraceae bacterium]|nr:DUF262 domain-containing protein [Lachnospiraceae bacterium]
MIEQSIEKSKTKQFSISSIIGKIDGYGFRFDNATQRESGQWSPKTKGNLISDILQGNPVPNLTFAEQIINGIVITWNLDGKQRCTTAYEFYNNKFRISRAIRRYEIEYQTIAKDACGEMLFNNEGYPVVEKRIFDIRNKRFRDLPRELQERFLDYTFDCTLYLNCSNEDIEYHVQRYNDGKPMTLAQKGMGALGTKFSGIVKRIADMPFFKDCGDYRMSEYRNGTIDKIVIEGIMASNYVDNWAKNEVMCAFLKENATESVFEKFADRIDRLEEIVTENLSDMFNSKDSFIWFAMFAKFDKLKLEDKQFAEFLAAFKDSLHGMEIGGTTYDEINESRNTKDKKVVVAKIDFLTGLMNEYFGISEQDSRKCA